MFKDSLYTIQKISAENGSVKATIKLNEDHEIFKAHFPSQPVLPGACMLQMIKEILETALTVKLQLSKAGEIKFLSMIQPSDTALQFSIEYNFITNISVNISAQILLNDVVCCKMKGLFQTKE
jgi:3-hydroxyacyl-[acyl-carrier-protein] dehydratase